MAVEATSEDIQKKFVEAVKTIAENVNSSKEHLELIEAIITDEDDIGCFYKFSYQNHIFSGRTSLGGFSVGDIVYVLFSGTQEDNIILCGKNYMLGNMVYLVSSISQYYLSSSSSIPPEDSVEGIGHWIDTYPDPTLALPYIWSRDKKIYSNNEIEFSAIKILNKNNSVFFQPEEPEAELLRVGDVWIDTDNGNILRMWTYDESSSTKLFWTIKTLSGLAYDKSIDDYLPQEEGSTNLPKVKRSDIINQLLNGVITGFGDSTSNDGTIWNLKTGKFQLGGFGKYINFVTTGDDAPKIVISLDNSSSSKAAKLELTSSAINFWMNADKVAYITDSKMHIRTSEVFSTLNIDNDQDLSNGYWQWVDRSVESPDFSGTIYDHLSLNYTKKA